MTQTVVVVCALGSAMAAASSTVLQHHTARRAPKRTASGLRLLLHLMASPPWLVGLLLAGIGLALHAVALAGGRLAVVQPLLVCGILFALPASIVLEGRRPSGSEGGWAVTLVVGLAAFLLIAHPSGGTVSTDADVLAWTTVAGAGAMVTAAVIGFRWAQYRAVLLAIAAGLGYGVAAALLKQTAAIAGSGIGAVLVDWPIYALVGVGACAIALTQLAYRAGSLAESLPVLTITDPASSIVIGALAFHETLAHSATAVSLEIAAFAVMGLASARLAR
ncbi:MAG: DMT family transporter [Acidothermaceae bacterium]